MDIYSKFCELAMPTSEPEFSAIPIPFRGNDYIAKDSLGAPVFLLLDRGNDKYRPNIELYHTSLQFHRKCRIRSNSEIIENNFAVLRCDSSRDDFYELFIRCVLSALGELPPVASTEDIQRVFNKLLELFRAMTKPSSRSIIGLWAELFVIRHSSNIKLALMSWHSAPFERYDFSTKSGRIEIKATTNTNRTHDFSMEQLNPFEKDQSWVISLILQPHNGGIGIIELAKQIEAANNHDPELNFKLWENIAITLGKDFSENSDTKFDVKFTERELRLFSMVSIPRISLPQSPLISEIRFKVQLASIEDFDSLRGFSAINFAFNSINC